MKRIISTLTLCLSIALATAQQTVPQEVMERIYHEVKTPHKYGLVILPPQADCMIDSPTLFRKGGMWYMTYIIFDGRGYETWLASSPNLLEWQTMGRILSYDESRWDRNQVAGYPALIEPEWGGKYRYPSFGGRRWMSYLGGDTQGYEAGVLSVGMAYTELDAIRALTGTQPYLVAGGGVCGCEGAAFFQCQGTNEQLEKLDYWLHQVSSTPRFSFANCK